MNYAIQMDPMTAQIIEATGFEDIIKTNQKILRAFEAWQATVQNGKEVVEHSRKMEELMRERFRAVVEEPVSTENQLAAREHLLRIQAEWQSLQEMQAGGIEERKEAREAIKLAAERFRVAMKEARQMELRFD